MTSRSALQCAAVTVTPRPFRKRSQWRPHRAAPAAALGLYALVAGAATAQERSPDGAEVAHAYEVAPVLSASSLVPQNWLGGPHFRVRDQVVTNGYRAQFVIDSDFGTFRCNGQTKLMQRVREVAALAELAQVSKSEVFFDAVKRSAEKPVEAVRNIAHDPGGAARQLPRTVGHFFRRAGKTVKEGVETIGDKISESDGRGTGEQITEAGKGTIGFNKALLRTAGDLGVDPYTDNQVLKDRMKEVSWVFYAGGLPLNLGVAVASGGASLALKATVATGLPSEVYQLTPAELRLRNQDDLAAMGVNEEAQDAFSRSPVLTPSVQRSIVSSLKGFAGAGGRSNVVALAGALKDREKGEFLAEALHALAERQRSGLARYRELVVLERLVGATDSISGTLHVPAPVDYVTWTKEVAEFARRGDLARLGQTPALCLNHGQMSAAARNGFIAAGWEIQPRPATVEVGQDPTAPRTQ